MPLAIYVCPVHHLAPKRGMLRVLTAVAPLGAMNVYIILDVISGYGRGTARRRSCIVVVWRPCRLEGLK